MLKKKKEVQENYIWVFKNGIPDSLFFWNPVKCKHPIGWLDQALLLAYALESRQSSVDGAHQNTIFKKRNPMKMELQNHKRKKVLTKVQAPGTCIYTLALSVC